MIILLSKFRVTKISVSYISGENHIGNIFFRQKYFCPPTEIAFLPKELWNIISGWCVTPPHTPVATDLKINYSKNGIKF
jgi:hypothetical protein